MESSEKKLLVGAGLGPKNSFGDLSVIHCLCRELHADQDSCAKSSSQPALPGLALRWQSASVSTES